MAMLMAAVAVFLGLHLLIAGTRVRDAITGAIGERPYLGLFSLASIAAIAWLMMAYNAAGATPGSAADPYLYQLGQGVHDLGLPIVALAFFLGVQGLLLPNPTSVQQEAAAARETTVQGVLRITRHPFLWGVMLWAAFHTAANGDEASVIFFGGFFLLALFGTFSIDAKRTRKMGAAWEGFAAKTSNLPFGAVLAGRTGLKLSESFGWRFWAAMALFLIVLFAHAHIFGVSPLPGGAVPI
ncbi:MAG: NnrU family protein [Alphaproteobacteria bacterium]|nr:NnrU family protein [Alphaproteobacteria bacterium]MBU6471411.1 NnrU family protein [Alphaproteobacteria bacterium]MDE2011925.1 NnrU family protein [Alphaproteobacteria bacterium]MDE2072492.1 NnrU family protein [Alphaproteobacteria bacterium]MDE2351111.1 NnrU family protein [Alphaproteobacteria bacterium]